MVKNSNNLQDIFLNNARTQKIIVSIYLLNGTKLSGVIKGFDNFTVILECKEKQLLIYKHSISTITPEKSILFDNRK